MGRERDNTSLFIRNISDDCRADELRKVMTHPSTNDVILMSHNDDVIFRSLPVLVQSRMFIFRWIIIRSAHVVSPTFSKSRDRI